MNNIIVKFRDGTEKSFRHEGRPGGSYTKTVRYEGSFVILCDEYNNETAYPNDTVKEVIKTSNNGRW